MNQNQGQPLQFDLIDYYRGNMALRSCSAGARGLWIQMMCVMHGCEPYGHLVVNGIAMRDEQAARLCGGKLKEYRELLRELEDAGVLSRTPGGVIYSREMVRDPVVVPIGKRSVS